MFTLIFCILLAVVVLLGMVISPVVAFIGLDILVVVGIVKLIINAFTKRKS